MERCRVQASITLTDSSIISHVKLPSGVYCISRSSFVLDISSECGDGDGDGDGDGEVVMVLFVAAAAAFVSTRKPF